MRFYRFLFIFFALPLNMLFAHDDCIPAQGVPLRIGAIFPPATLFNTDAGDAYRGVEAMVMAWNQCAGGRPVELVYVPAADRADALAAVEQLRGEVSLIIGSGSTAVSETLVEASAHGDFIVWEVTEALDVSHDFAFSPRPNSAQLGQFAAGYISSHIPSLLEGEPLRLAVIYEDQPRAERIAAGALKVLEPDIERVYDANNSYPLAVQMRESHINVMLFITLNPTTQHLKANLLQADANLDAWVQVSSAFYQPDICQVISITPSGRISEADRADSLGVLEEIYREQYGEQPSAQADLAASGVYLLLHELLPEESTVESIQTALMSGKAQAVGLMNEGWQLEAGVNAAASAIVQQVQPQGLCILSPDSLATCTRSLMHFPTWREQVRLSSCGGE